MTLKKFVGLLFVVLICHAGIIEQSVEEINYEDLDLSGNDDGQFAADLDGAQELGLSDQSFKSGPWKGIWGEYGDEHSSEIIHGGHGVVQYLTTSLRSSPEIIVFDNSYLYFGRYPSIRRRCNYNRVNHRFNFIGGWQGNIHTMSHHAKQIAKLWDDVVSIRYSNNFNRCYNAVSQAVIVSQRITHPFASCQQWQPPVFPVDYNQYQVYNPYRNWPGYVGSTRND